jgi:hypothetical protein
MVCHLFKNSKILQIESYRFSQRCQIIGYIIETDGLEIPQLKMKFMIIPKYKSDRKEGL